ncbi:MAG TPA: class I SAM-dependent methyltransferase [Rhizomicrobium sp.]|nr:class I SAM-dependent methyltransferase [Rhizomicrobium sp.]
MYTPPAFRDDGALPLIATEPAGACMVCGGNRSVPKASGFDFELETCRNRWTFQSCMACGHVQLDPRPAPQTLETIYPPTYYSYAMRDTLSPVAIAGKAFLDRAKFRGFLRLLRRPARSYMDIGCGDFKYLDLMHREGLAPENLYGLELDEAAVSRARKKGYQAFHARAETATGIPRGAIDVATMFHVIEHVADPGAVLHSVSRWLSPDGILVIETPNVAALDAQLFARRYWGGYHIPRHWHLFTPEGITRLLEQNGFRVRAIRYQTGHSFWLYSLHHAIRYNPILPSAMLSRLFDPLRSLPMLVLVTALDKLRALLGMRTSAMLVIAERATPDADANHRHG